MIEKKGYKPLKKTLSYMRRMINVGKWKANNRIPTLAVIAMKIGTSSSTVRKAIRQLEIDRLIDNNGSLGFCVVPPNMTKLFHSDKQRYYLILLKANVSTLEMLDAGGYPIGKFIVQNNNTFLKIHNVISGETINTIRSELEDSIYNPISLASLVTLNGPKLINAKKKYFKQQKLRDIAKVLLKNKETLI